jgi:hypothetical protein
MLPLRQLLAAGPKVVLSKHVLGEAFARGRWRIIGHADMPADFVYPAFYGGGPLAHGTYILWRGNDEDRVPKEEAMKHEPAMLFGPERIEEALLKQKFERWPEIEQSKKRTFGRAHEAGLRSLARLGIPTEPEA